MTYLDFEKPIQDLETELDKLKDVSVKSKVNLDDKVKELEATILQKTKELYTNLTPCSSINVLLLT